MDLVSRDIISNLPNPLISHILSFLPTKEAISTSVLSKKWHYLFAYVTNLDFDDLVYLHPEVGKPEDEDDYECTRSFMEFMNKVLILQRKGTVSRISINCTDYVNPVYAIGWIYDVLGRGVSDLDLSLLEYSLPSKIFVSKTLIRLKLGPADDLSFTMDTKYVFLPKLKTLNIDSIVFEERGFGFVKLFSGCHVLEELVLMNIGWENWQFYTVSIKTLKRLTFFCEDTDENPKSMSFDTPNLVYLEYSDVITGKYPKVNLSSLVEAHIGLRRTEDQTT